MSGELFQEWVDELDIKFLAQKRKVALVVDNCPAHPEVENLKVIKLVFLLPSTISKTQPLDQGGNSKFKGKVRSFGCNRHASSIVVYSI